MNPVKISKQMEVTFCDMLVDAINVENGVQEEQTTNVKSWTIDNKGGVMMLTAIEDDENIITVDAILSNKRCLDYVKEKLGYDVPTIEYTYKVPVNSYKNKKNKYRPYKGIAVVLDPNSLPF